MPPGCSGSADDYGANVAVALRAALEQLPRQLRHGPSPSCSSSDPELYPSPERFDPERFLGASRPLGEFFPFGGGARRCLGASFAMQELRTVLAVLVREARLRLLDAETPKPVRRSTVTGPRGDVPLVYEGPAERARSRTGRLSAPL